MCRTCRQVEEETNSQAEWLRSFGLNPFAHEPYRNQYLRRLDGCPEGKSLSEEG
jgi:hypothetical protein